MYSLESEMMIQVLLQFGYSGDCHADIPPQGPLKSGARAVLVAEKGKVTSISLFSRDGKKQYDDREARSLLSRLGVLDWTLVPSQSAPSTQIARTPFPDRPSHLDTLLPRTPFPVRPSYPDTPPPGTPLPTRPSYTARNADFRPRRVPVPQSQLRSWPASHRAVYALIDGVRSVEQIAALLSRPPATIEQIILELRSQNALE